VERYAFLLVIMPHLNLNLYLLIDQQSSGPGVLLRKCRPITLIGLSFSYFDLQLYRYLNLQLTLLLPRLQ
jgi:hypothetical protein